jgi:hypothetical protein
MRATAWAAALALLGIGAPAQAQDNPACAKFEEPLAYNACLARLGPRAAATRGVPEPDGGTRGARHARGGPEIVRTRKGRVRAEFTIR